MIKTYRTQQSKEWDEIVKSFRNYDVYYLSGYVKAFELNGDGQAMLIYYKNKDMTTRAINVVMKRDIHEYGPLESEIEQNELFDIATPYGYGGFLIEGDDVESLKCEYNFWAERSHIVSESVRFHPILNNHCSVLYDDIHLGETVYIDTSSEEAVWSNLTSQNRNKIRKAIKSGQEVYWCRDPRIIDTFMEIYNETMDKDSADLYYYFKKEFYESIMEDLKDNVLWMYTMKGDVITAIGIFLFANGQMHYHLSGQRREFQNTAPMNLLLFEAARWACRNGYKTLHLGGGVGSKNDSLYTFKKSFNRGLDAEFHIGRKIFDEKAYNRLVEIRKWESIYDENTTYFPAYRGEG